MTSAMAEYEQDQQHVLSQDIPSSHLVPANSCQFDDSCSLQRTGVQLSHFVTEPQLHIYEPISSRTSGSPIG